METGKVEYAPDYKSAIKKLRELRNCSPEEAARQKKSFRQLEQDLNYDAELQRLQSALLSAIKKWRGNFSPRPEYSTGLRGIDLPVARAVDDLIAFEVENGIGDD